MTQARDETDLQSELDSAKQEIAKLQGELIKAEAEKNKLRQQFNMPPMQKVLMQGKRARGEELDQEVSCFFLIIDIVTMFFCQLVNKKRSLTHVSLRIQKRAPPCLISSLNVQIYCMPLKLKRF